MFFAFIFAAAFTIGISALCSILEAMLLSTTTVEIESLKKTHRKRGKQLEKYRLELEETSSAILSLNTIANTLGATFVGGLAVQIWARQEHTLLVVSTVMAVMILLFSEIIPKNIGVLYRPGLLPIFIFPLSWVCLIMAPLSRTVGFLVRIVLRPKEVNPDSDKEILLLAEKSANEGTLTKNEHDMISNALSLDGLSVSEIMTPRTVVYAIDGEESVGSILKKNKNLPFARIPLYRNRTDNIIGIVRRRDILTAGATNKDALPVKDLANTSIFIPDNATASDALQTLLKCHRQLAITVDEFGSMSGVISIEDVIEHIIGQEIFEEDDPAVDMRELARIRQFAEKRRQRKES